MINIGSVHGSLFRQIWRLSCNCVVILRSPGGLLKLAETTPRTFIPAEQLAFNALLLPSLVVDNELERYDSIMKIWKHLGNGIR